jgi:DNA phosphorothioation-dependent restriction protein DptG
VTEHRKPARSAEERIETLEAGLTEGQRVNDELRCLIDTIKERLEAEIRRLDDLREADKLAVEVAHEGVRERMEGFPQQYATKSEQDAIKETAQRLEKDSIAREIYDNAMAGMQTNVSNKLDKQVFDSTLAEWVTWRRQVEQRLTAASGIQAGVGKTFAWAIAGLGAVATAVAIALALSG